MKTVSSMFIVPAIILLFLAAQGTNAEVFLGFPLNESPDMAGTHGLYNHGASYDSGNYAPGGYSSQSSRHDLNPATNPSVEGDGAFWGITGDVADPNGPTMSWVIWLNIDSSQWNSAHHTAVFALAEGSAYNAVPGEVIMTFDDTSRVLRFRIGGAGLVSSAVGMPLDQWFHVAATFDNGIMNLYIDGDLVDSQDYSASMTSFPVLLGREGWLGTAPNNGGLTEGMMGWIDEFAWYDEALTEADVEDIITRGIVEHEKPYFPPTPVEILTGFVLNEVGELSGNHGLYGHGASWDTSQYAPGGYSSQSSRHNIDPNLPLNPDGAFWGITGNYAGYTAPDMSWLLWLKIDSSQWVSDYHTAVLAFADGNLYNGAPGEIFVYIEDTSRRAHVVLGGIGQVISPAGLPMDQWVHVAATFSRGDLKLYIDGTQVDSQSYSIYEFPALAGREGWLGTAPNNGQYFEGMMGWLDEFAWYQGLLTAADIEDIIDRGLIAHEAGIPDPNLTPPIPIEFLMGFELDESPDISGNHGLYRHGASIDSTMYAPGGYSVESSHHNLDPNLNLNPDGSFWGITGNMANYSTPEMSMVLWLNVDSSQWVSNHITAILCFANGNTYDSQPGEIYVSLEDTNARLHFNIAGAGALVTDSGLPMDQWVHVACTLSYGVMKLYLDGAPVKMATTTLTEFPALAGREGWLGTAPNHGGYTEGFMGWIDEFAWFKGALTEANVDYIIAHGLRGFNAAQPPENCGDPGTVYLPGDLNRDCYVDITDLSKLAGDWLVTNEP